MEQITEGITLEEESLKVFENLISKVVKDMNSLECRLLDRFRSMETTILSNIYGSNSNIAAWKQDINGIYLTVNDLEDTYTVLESLVQDALSQAKCLDGTNSLDDRQLAKVKERMASVAAKLEQMSGLVKVINSDRITPCNFGSNYAAKTSPPSGCGDVIGQAPFGLALQGISQSKTSLSDGNSFIYGGSNFTMQKDNTGFESNDSGMVDDYDFKNDLGKLLVLINNSNSLDLQRYVLSSTNGANFQGHYLENRRSSMACHQCRNSNIEKPPTPTEITLDTLVPCANDMESLFCVSQTEMIGDRQFELETSFPSSTCDQSEYLSHSQGLIQHEMNANRLDPTDYQINPAMASSANINMVDALASSSSTSPFSDKMETKQYKRTRSFNASSYYTPQKQTKKLRNDHTNRPTSVFYESLNSRTSSTQYNDSYSPTSTACNPSESIPTTQTHFPPSKCSSVVTSVYNPLYSHNFRRVKSEMTVKRHESSERRSKETPEKVAEHYFSENNYVDVDDIKPLEGWKPKRKVLFHPISDGARPSSCCVMTSSDFDTSNFFCNRDLPFIDQTMNTSPDNDTNREANIEANIETPLRNSYYRYHESPDDNIYLSPMTNNSSPAEDVGSSTRPAYANIRNEFVTPKRSEVEGEQSLADLVWPSPGHVTYRKNAAKLRSRWDGFRRAFSMVFEKNGNNNNNNNNNNNDDDDDYNNINNNSGSVSYMFRKASSTNYLDGGRHQEPAEERKRSKSNWDVWKKQSRANLSESFRRKCGWLRATFKRKRFKGHLDFQGHSEPYGDIADSPKADEDELEKTKIIMKSTLASVTDELLKTEGDYVNSMQYVIDNYISSFNDDNKQIDNNTTNTVNSYNDSPQNLNSKNNSSAHDLPEQLRRKKSVVFGNLEKLLDFHARKFHESLLMCRGHPYALGSAFLRHESEFELYSLYSENKPKSDQLMNDGARKYFQVKQMELMDPMDLESYLLKPIQRLSKYALMLKKILQTCPMDRLEYTELEAALEMVRFQLRHGEDLLAADCISGCDVNLQEQGMLIRREDLLVMKGLRKCQRHVFLFEDLILFTKTKRKPGGQDTYEYRHSLKTTDIGLTESVGDCGRQFEIWYRKRRPENSYKLQAGSRDSKEKWTTDITALLWGQTQKFRPRMITPMATGGNVTTLDANCSRPISFASSSSSNSSSNNSMDYRTSSIVLRHTSSMSSSSSSSSPSTTLTLSMDVSGQNSSHLRPLGMFQPANQVEGTSSAVRPLIFSLKTNPKCCLSPFYHGSPTQHGIPKLSPVKEQLT